VKRNGFQVFDGHLAALRGRSDVDGGLLTLPMASVEDGGDDASVAVPGGPV